MIRRSTFIILLLFIGLVGLTYYLQRTDTREEESVIPTEENAFLFKIDSEIQGLRLEHVGSGVVELVKNDQGTWELTWPEAEETNIGAVESAISQLLSLRIVSELGMEPGLEQTGLSDPNYRLLIRISDGSQKVMAVGRETPTGSGYYVQVDNRGMFVVNKYSLDPFLNLVDQPPIQPTATATSNLDVEQLPAASPSGNP